MIDLVVEEKRWLTALPDLPDVAEQAGLLALQAVDLIPERYEVSLLACDDSRISTLNADFRGKSVPTNVLSWPAFPLAPPAPGKVPPLPPAGSVETPVPLGDVAISLQFCEAEAANHALPLKNHVIHLIFHGCLHLLGYDHQTDADADVMEGIESRALTGIGLADPYA